jgi:arylsulfatase A-like enzyme
MILLNSALFISSTLSILLIVKSVIDISRSGPEIQAEIQRHYVLYTVYGIARLAFWAWALLMGMSVFGEVIYGAFLYLYGAAPNFVSASFFALFSCLGISAYLFLDKLLYSPSTIAMSSHYRMSRFNKIWRYLSPTRLLILRNLILFPIFTLLTLALLAWGFEKKAAALGLAAVLAGAMAIIWRWHKQSEINPAALKTKNSNPDKPNIIMIGSDTLRADRLNVEGYKRNLTPTLDRLAHQGAYFAQHYVPIARTAPSLVSLMLGKWPHRTGVRDNFVSNAEAKLKSDSLASLLNQAGYYSAVIGDWTGGDYKKFDFGFNFHDVPEDQWNIKYLIKQGPKDIRLFLSLFTHNHFGKKFIPEIYYFAGIPLVESIVADSKHLLNKLTQEAKPFLLNIFMGATHPPFGSVYPYYSLYADKNYDGESKFCMSKLTDPLEIIKSQQEPREAFDLDQVIDIYDGCVKYFDDAVANILTHVESLGINKNTIIVIYSDHGMELFENNTWGQGNSVFTDYSSHVPFIIYDPRRQPSGIVRRLTRSIDVAPTLLELVGLHKPSDWDGVSLIPYLNDADEDLDLHAYSETGIWLTQLPGMPENHLSYPNLLNLLDIPDKSSGALAIKESYRKIIILAKDRMVRKGDWKLVYVPLTTGEQYYLFNTKKSPKHQVDVSQQYPEIYQELKQILLSHLCWDKEA